MRLQLIVQRHSLPPVQILWTAGVLRPPYAAAGASCTISQFLEQVNDVIPLECEDWGLEDYAVEVRGFECLHFAELEQVLKDDDEVCIRPLQTSDLRFRKVSGRHQISADGKHLIDGVAFGRPFLRRADRPSVRIPPRKRRRIAYEEEDEDIGEEITDRQLMIRANFDDADVSDEDSDDQDDEEFSLTEGEDLAEELDDLQHDLQEDTHSGLQDAERALNLDGAEEASGRKTRSRPRRRTGLGLRGPALIELVDGNGRPYPEEYNNPLLDLFGGNEPVHEPLNNKPSKRRKSRRLRNIAGRGNSAAKNPSASPRSENGPAPSGSTKAVQFDSAETATPATVRLDKDAEEFEAGATNRQKGIEPDLDSDKENAEPQDEEINPDKSPSIEIDTSSAISSSSESESEDTSSESSSSSSSGSDDENVPSSRRKRSTRSPTSSTTSSSRDSNSSESGPENLSSKLGKRLEEGLGPQGSEFEPTAPAHGKKQTRNRNQRRRDCKKRAYLVKIGVLSSNATLEDFRRADAERRKAGVGHLDKVSQESAPKAIDSDAAFEARREALLASLKAGGVDMNAILDREDEAPARTEKVVEDRVLENPKDDAPMADDRVEVENSQQSRTAEAPIENETTSRQSTSTSEEAVAKEDLASPQSSKRRSKLDLASSRRLLFGSLGLRAPKTKEEESSLRKKLRNDIRPTKVIQGNALVQPSEEFITDGIGEDQSWKGKVILNAVECCQEGVELSTPPFPFVQRWDPQQQRGYGGRGGRGKTSSKKRKRKSKQHNEDLEEQGAHYDVSQQQPPTYFEDEHEGTERAVKPKLDAQSQNVLSSEIDERAVNDQLMRESEGISASMYIESEETKDLPDLPEDMSLCPDLSQENCTPGTIVAFKQLDMSAETNWQPRVSEYKTATIDRLMDDGALRMTLAKRDHPAKEELYDDETGERVYGKFEMPGYEDDAGDDASGIIELPFADLIHPKLIQAVEPQLNEDQLHQLKEQAVSPEYDEDTAIVVRSADLYPSLDTSTSSKPNQPVHDAKADGVNELVRKEIRELITDAGWHSSVSSNVLVTGPHPESNVLQHKTDNAIRISSPKFTGFSSSPPPNRPAPSNDELQPDLTGIETDESFLPQTVAETIAATSPRSELMTNDKVEKSLSIVKEVNMDIIGDDSPSKPVSAEGDPQVGSEWPSSPGSTPKPASQSFRLHGGISQRKPLPQQSYDGADSDDEFPTLEDVLASTRSSFESLVPEDEGSTHAGKSSFETIPSTDEDQKRQRRSKSDAKRNIRKQSKLLPESRTFKEEDEEGFTPRLSQVPLGSQIVDLTMSSDPVYSPGSDDDDDTYEMPSGPGWVRKTKAGSKHSSLLKGASLRSRTRSSV